MAGAYSSLGSEQSVSMGLGDLLKPRDPSYARSLSAATNLYPNSYTKTTGHTSLLKEYERDVECDKPVSKRTQSFNMASSRLPNINEGKGSSRLAFVTFFKAYFGAGILGMPHAFSRSGVAGGFIILMLVNGNYSFTLLFRGYLVAYA